MMEAKEKLAYNVHEAAELIGVSDITIRRMLKRKELPSVRCGDRWLIPVVGLNKWLETTPQNAPETKQARCVKAHPSEDK